MSPMILQYDSKHSELDNHFECAMRDPDARIGNMHQVVCGQQNVHIGDSPMTKNSSILNSTFQTLELQQMTPLHEAQQITENHVCEIRPSPIPKSPHSNSRPAGGHPADEHQQQQVCKLVLLGFARPLAGAMRLVGSACRAAFAPTSDRQKRIAPALCIGQQETLMLEAASAASNALGQ
ncbi:unnamed protein product [Prorocentrum cordatum]|uniref:Uncharacterized protein n=1 Tax=Prorocentrum cordatum TaxID=2364126 RepID=A0ABN9UNJ4_9DINO|nr:unnamed protein product [Polarella glacialis]